MPDEAEQSAAAGPSPAAWWRPEPNGAMGGPAPDHRAVEGRTVEPGDAVDRKRAGWLRDAEEECRVVLARAQHQVARVGLDVETLRTSLEAECVRLLNDAAMAASQLQGDAERNAARALADAQRQAGAIVAAAHAEAARVRDEAAAGASAPGSFVVDLGRLRTGLAGLASDADDLSGVLDVLQRALMHEPNPDPEFGALASGRGFESTHGILAGSIPGSWRPTVWWEADGDESDAGDDSTVVSAPQE